MYRFTGTKSKVINMGSYNYLGFAETKGPCADDSVAATRKYGCGVCSTRQELGTCLSNVCSMRQKLGTCFSSVCHVNIALSLIWR